MPSTDYYIATGIFGHSVGDFTTAPVIDVAAMNTDYAADQAALPVIQRGPDLNFKDDIVTMPAHWVYHDHQHFHDFEVNQITRDYLENYEGKTALQDRTDAEIDARLLTDTNSNGDPIHFAHTAGISSSYPGKILFDCELPDHLMDMILYAEAGSHVYLQYRCLEVKRRMARIKLAFPNATLLLYGMPVLHRFSQMKHRQGSIKHLVKLCAQHGLFDYADGIMAPVYTVFDPKDGPTLWEQAVTLLSTRSAAIMQDLTTDTSVFPNGMPWYAGVTDRTYNGRSRAAKSLSCRRFQSHVIKHSIDKGCAGIILWVEAQEDIDEAVDMVSTNGWRYRGWAYSYPEETAAPAWIAANPAPAGDTDGHSAACSGCSDPACPLAD